MACAPCIRGHRSTSCQHTDRNLLEVRKKGRPMSQCDHCRDLRKVKQVHVRCKCKPDESEAPKRKGKGKKANVGDQAPCTCDATGVCNCATPRTSASRAAHQSSIPASTSSVSPVSPNPTDPTTSAPAGHLEKSWPSCCLTTDPSSDAPSLKTHGACMGNTSGTESCSTSPQTPLEANPTHSVGNPAPDLRHFIPDRSQAPSTAPELTRFNSEHPTLSIDPDYSLLNFSQPVDGPVPFISPPKSHRYTPYPTATQQPSPAYPGPSRPSRVVPNTDQAGSFDSATLALWDQFLREDSSTTDNADNNQHMSDPFPLVTQTTTSTKTTDVHFPFHNTPPSSTCSCSPGSTCQSCSSGKSFQMPQSAATLLPAPCNGPCVEFDCSTLVAALSLIDEDPADIGQNMASTLPPAASTTAASYTTTPLPSSSQSASISNTLYGEIFPTSQMHETAKASATQLKTTAMSTICTCLQKCGCFFCPGNSSDAPITEVECQSFQNCAFCNSCQALNKAVTEAQRMTVAPIF